MGVLWRMHGGKDGGSSKNAIKENRESCCSNLREMMGFCIQVQLSEVFCYPLLMLFVHFITLTILPCL